MPEIKDWAAKVGRYIKEKRQKEGKTVQEVAHRTGVDLGLVEKVENGDLDGMSLREYKQILSEGYEVEDLRSALLEILGTDPLVQEEWAYISNDRTGYIKWGGKSVKWQLWMPKLKGGQMEPEILTLDPRRTKEEIGKTREASHEGEELLYIISGRLKASLFDEKRRQYGPAFELKAGEILHFDPQVRHYLENASTTARAEILVIRIGEPRRPDKKKRGPASRRGK